MRPTTAIASHSISLQPQPLYGVSRTSSVTVLPSFSPADDASVRSAAIVRPWRPIILPASDGATYSSTSVVPLCCVSTTCTSSGRSASALASTSTTALMPVASLTALRLGRCGFGRRRLGRQMARHQRPHRIGRPRAAAEPVVDALFVDLDDRRLRARIVVTEDFDEGAVARGPRIGHDDAEERT